MFVSIQIMQEGEKGSQEEAVSGGSRIGGPAEKKQEG